LEAVDRSEIVSAKVWQPAAENGINLYAWLFSARVLPAAL